MSAGNVVKSVLPQRRFRHRDVLRVAAMRKQYVDLCRIFRPQRIVKTVCDLFMPVTEPVNARLILRQFHSLYLFTVKKDHIFRKRKAPVIGSRMHIIVIPRDQRHFGTGKPAEEFVDLL